MAQKEPKESPGWVLERLEGLHVTGQSRQELWVEQRKLVLNKAFALVVSEKKAQLQTLDGLNRGGLSIAIH